ncbi:MAG: hypothetical protein ABID38_01430 [Candidatus Diapherotrites archaeon]
MPDIKERIKSIVDFFDEVGNNLDGGKEFEFWKFIDELDELKEKITDERVGEIEENVVVKGKLFLGKNSAIKSGTYIEGDAYIGADCVIGPNAYLRGTVLIACEAHIANSEIKNSIILKGSKIPHFSYVGDSLIGKDVNLGAGTKIANLRHDGGNIKVSVQGKKIDSGRRKLGALIGNNSKLGINTSVNCGKIIAPNSKTSPGEFVK